MCNIGWVVVIGFKLLGMFCEIFIEVRGIMENTFFFPETVELGQRILGELENLKREKKG